MINEIEMSFINEYIVDLKKDRLIYEFQKKREHALTRFSHNIEKTVKSDLIRYRCNVNNLYSCICWSRDLYVISRAKINGEVCSFEEVLKHLKEQCMPVIIISKEFVVIKTEDDDIKDNVFILFNN